MPERNWPSWSTKLRTSAVEIERVVETSASAKYDQYLRSYEKIEATIADPANDPEVALQEKDRGELVRRALMRKSDPCVDWSAVPEARVADDKS